MKPSRLFPIFAAILLGGCMSQQDNPVATRLNENVSPVISTFAVYPTQGIAPLRVEYTATATDVDRDSLTYSWNFGDGTPVAVGTSGNHLFQDPGTYTVQMTVTDGEGGSVSRVAAVTVTSTGSINHSPIITTFVVSPTQGTAPLVVTYSATATDQDQDTLSYSWNFGNGTTLTGTSGTHQFAAIGTYTVRLVVNDGKGGSDTQYATVVVGSVITVNHPPFITGFSVSPTQGTVPLVVTYSAEATDQDNDALGYSWNFGDGTSVAIGASNTHTFTASGTYTVRLVVSDGQGGSDSRYMTVTVGSVIVTNHPPSITAFSVSPTQGTAPLTVNYLVEAEDQDQDILSCIWNFGDGTTVTNTSGVHTYTAVGTYTVKLTVSDGRGGTDVQYATVVVGVIPSTNRPPTITAFSVSPTQGTAPLTVTYSTAATDQDVGDVLSYTWSFGDGTTITGVSGTHTYTTVGTYTVRLVVSDGKGGSDAQYATVSVTAAIPPPNHSPQIGTCSMSPSQGPAPLTVTYTGAATDADQDVLTYTWDFRDGTAVVIGASGTHIFAAEGIYQVHLTVSDGNGGTDEDYVLVSVTEEMSSVNHHPVISTCAAIPQQGVAPLTVTYVGAASDQDGDALTYSWDFRDGTSPSSLASGGHTYTVPGTYRMRLTVSDEHGGSDVDSVAVTVTETPPPVNHNPVITAFAVYPDRGIVPHAVTYEAIAVDEDGDPVTYSWVFGDGTNATGTPVSHTYTVTGTYTVFLAVSDGRGGMDDRQMDVIVSPPPDTSMVVWEQSVNMTLRPDPSPSWKQSVNLGNVAGVTYLWVRYQLACGADARLVVTFTDAGGHVFNFTLAYNGITMAQWAVVGGGPLDLPANCNVTFMYLGPENSNARVTGVRGTH